MLYDPKWEQQTKADPVLRILVEAKKLIASETNWCQSYSEWRTGDNGKPRLAICAVHALQKAWGSIQRHGDDARIETEAFRALGRAVGLEGHGPDIGQWNDSHAHTEVLAAFDRAIAAQQSA